MKRRPVALLLVMTACGSTLDLGARRGTDAGSSNGELDGGRSSSELDGGRSSSDGSGLADTTPGAAGATCGAGTARKSCRVFLTNARAEADFGGFEGGDARCKAAADGAGLDGTYKAFLSDGKIAAWSRYASDGPWMLIATSELLFADRNALKVDGPKTLNRDENGDVLDITGHWTGVREQGFPEDSCQGFTSMAKDLRGSFGNTAPSRWLYQADVTCDSEVGLHLLCLED